MAIAILNGFLAAAIAGTTTASAQGWHSGFSSIVVDGKTGRVLHANEADALRHPASLAKIMTLYLLFAEIEAGRLRLDSRITMSAHAASQPPSKLGLKAGQTISVEDAIRAIVTRSGNDIAVAIAEAISGDHESFARLMTNRARMLGMQRTVFKNASGLPHREQVTTAREMALLGLAIQDRFPTLYKYFATRTFRWRGVAINNHNRLLGTVGGVDGIKTGYTRASGFNLVTNVKRGDRHIVGVVLGGRTGAVRNEIMRDLITENIRHASTGPRTLPRFAEGPPMPQPNPRATAAAAAPQPGSGDPIRPTQVRVLPVGKEAETTAKGDKKPTQVLSVASMSGPSTGEPLRITPIVPTGLAPNGKIVTFAPPPPPASVPTASAQESPEVERAPVLSAYAPKAKESNPPAPPPASVASTPEARRASMSAASPPSRGAWIIQVGAFTAEEHARERLVKARQRLGSVLADANPYTEKTMRGSTEYVRARFAGFDEASARRACAALQRNNIACLAMRN